MKTADSLVLEGERVLLRPLTPSDVTQVYCGWMNDPEVNRFLETRFQHQTEEGLKCYVAQKREDPQVIFWAILMKEENRHIGNIKLDPINPIHRTGVIGFLIGEKSYWGQGLITEAICLVCDYAFGVLNLHKLTAGCYSTNIGSAKTLQKAGFVQEGLQREQFLSDNIYVDELLFGLVRPSERPEG